MSCNISISLKNKMSKRFKYIIILAGIFIVVLIASFLGVGGVTGVIFFPTQLSKFITKSSSSNQEIPIPSGSNVLLKAGGYDLSSTKRLEVSTNTNTDSYTFINVTFYEGSCNLASYLHSLPVVKKSIVPVADIRLAMNYEYGDTPLFAGGDNSTLVYLTSAKRTHDLSNCPLELFLFTTEKSYTQFINSHLCENGFIQRSGCLPVGRNGTAELSTTLFNLTTPSSYYVAAYIEEGLDVIINVSGNIVQYSLHGFDLDKDCILNQNHNKCSLTISDKNIQTSNDKVCVLSQASEFVLINVTTISEFHNEKIVHIATALSGVAILLAVMKFVVLFVILVLKCMCRQHAEHEDEKKLLLPIPSSETDQDAPVTKTKPSMN